MADVFDALLSQRPYKEAWTADSAASEIEAGKGRHFDPAIADAFLSLYRSGRLDDLIDNAGDSAV